jgi:hypothetical protein
MGVLRELGVALSVSIESKGEGRHCGCQMKFLIVGPDCRSTREAYVKGIDDELV